MRCADQRTVLAAVVAATRYSLRLSLFGFVLGVATGLFLAAVMTRFNLARCAVLPYLVLSQTVPLIARAPITVSWGGKLHLFGFDFEKWMSAALLSAFLAFFVAERSIFGSSRRSRTGRSTQGRVAVGSTVLYLR